MLKFFPFMQFPVLRIYSRRCFFWLRRGSPMLEVICNQRLLLEMMPSISETFSRKLLSRRQSESSLESLHHLMGFWASITLLHIADISGWPSLSCHSSVIRDVWTSSSALPGLFEGSLIVYKAYGLTTISPDLGVYSWDWTFMKPKGCGLLKSGQQ